MKNLFENWNDMTDDPSAPRPSKPPVPRVPLAATSALTPAKAAATDDDSALSVGPTSRLNPAGRGPSQWASLRNSYAADAEHSEDEFDVDDDAEVRYSIRPAEGPGNVRINIAPTPGH